MTPRGFPSSMQVHFYVKSGYGFMCVHNTKVDPSCRVNLALIQALLAAFAAQFNGES